MGGFERRGEGRDGTGVDSKVKVAFDLVVVEFEALVVVGV